MNTRTAAPAIFTVSLVVLISGGAGTAAWGGPVRDDRTPTIVGIARGHVVVRDDLSPTRGADPFSGIVATASQAGFSGDALRELHSRGPAPQTVPGFTADARRELHSQAPAAQANTGFSADVIRELKGNAPLSARELSAEARRELHAQVQTPTRATAADVQGQRLAAYAESVAGTERPSASEMQGQRLSGYADTLNGTTGTDAVDDDLSPLGGPQ